jgi:hypothetical protein
VTTAAMTAPTPTTPPDNARCPGCTTAAFTGWKTGAGEVLLRCGTCDRIMHRALPEDFAHQPVDERCHVANGWPQSGSWRWAGFIKAAGGLWLLVAQAETLGGLWDALDSSWVSGERLCLRPKVGRT